MDVLKLQKLLLESNPELRAPVLVALPTINETEAYAVVELMLVQIVDGEMCFPEELEDEDKGEQAVLLIALPENNRTDDDVAR